MPSPPAPQPSRDATPPTFVVAAVCLRDSSGRVLTVRKRGTESFMLVGGKIEPGETPAQAALRETAEEVGLDLDEVRPLGHFVADAGNEPGHLVDSTVFTAPLAGEPHVYGEIEELRGLDPADLDVAMNGVWVCRSSTPAEDPAGVNLDDREVSVTIDLKAGSERATIWTNDLTHAYFHENSPYSS